MKLFYFYGIIQTVITIHTLFSKWHKHHHTKRSCRYTTIPIRKTVDTSAASYPTMKASTPPSHPEYSAQS